MSTVRKNKITVPLNSDAWNLVPDLTTMADTSNVIIKVASTTERDALPSPAQGDKVARTDLPGSPLETYDTTAGAWIPAYTALGANGLTSWTVSGQFYSLRFGDRLLIQGNLTLLRTGGAMSCPGGAVAFTSIGVIAPSTAFAASSQPIGWNSFVSGSGTNDEFQLIFNPVNGNISARGSGGTTSWPTGGQTSFQLNYIA